jgi:hypothetical protein
MKIRVNPFDPYSSVVYFLRSKTMSRQIRCNDTYKDRLRQLTMNHVGQNELGIVYRDGAFDHFEEPGYHRRPSLWNAKLVKKLTLIPCSTRTTLTVQTANGFEVKITAGINYCFDPRQAAPTRQRDLAHIALQDHPETLLNRRIRALVKTGLDEYVGRLRTDQLMQNGAIIQIQEWLLAYLHDLLHPDGILLADPDGVVIEGLQFPDSIVLAHCEAYIIQQIAGAISLCPPEVQELVMTNILGRRDGATVHLYGGTKGMVTGNGPGNGAAVPSSTTEPLARPQRPPASQRRDDWLNNYQKS